MSSLETIALAWRTQKEGEAEADCEDSVEAAAGDQIFSIADGVTQSFYAGLWADQLTSYFANQPEQAFRNWSAWLSVPQRNWLNLVRRCLEARPDNVYIYNALNERRPGASTFVGLRLLPTEHGDRIPWEALVLGDSCLFHLRCGGEVSCYLKQTEADFEFRTEAAESYPRTSQRFPTHLRSSADRNAEANGTTPARPGDCFLLATDALSKWMLVRQNASEPVWGAVANLKNETEFQKLVSAARSDAIRPLENDDVGLVVVRFCELDATFADQKYEATPAACLKHAETSPPSAKSGLVLSRKFGTALALGLSLVDNLIPAIHLEKSYRERDQALRSIHSMHPDAVLSD